MSATASKPQRRFIGKTSAGPYKLTAGPVGQQVPPEILDDAQLNQAIAALPANYSFEIHKTVHHIRKNGAKMVALQMPEGLLMFSCTISDVIEQFTNASTIIMGDVTYGACCIDDYTAVALGCDMLVHYGHSCLVPIDQTTIKTLYIFVEIAIDSSHVADTVRLNLPSSRTEFHRRFPGQDMPSQNQIALEESAAEPHGKPLDDTSQSPEMATRLGLVSTIQFVAALQQLKEDLVSSQPPSSQSSCLTLENASHDSSRTISQASHPQQPTFEAVIPRSRPLSPGEILGCTAPFVKDLDALIYLGDGRFHLEAVMIANPDIPAFRYDPYSKKFTREYYKFDEMRDIRRDAVVHAQKTLGGSPSSGPETMWGVVLGTLGRQGSFKQLQALTHQLELVRNPIPFMPILISELSPAKLSLFENQLSAFIQTSCPRLSIDWGYAFEQPLLSPYEASVAMGRLPLFTKVREGQRKRKGSEYPMDFYDMKSPWAEMRLKGSESRILLAADER